MPRLLWPCWSPAPNYRHKAKAFRWTLRLPPAQEGVPVSAVAEIVDPVFRNTYALGDYYPFSSDSEGSDLTETLFEMTNADEYGVIWALGNALIEGDNQWPPAGEEPFYDHGSKYLLDQGRFDEYSHSWEICQNRILHEQRFFNRDAFATLQKIFDGLHLLRDDSDRPPIYQINPKAADAEFFRARIFSSEDDQQSIVNDPARELGPPPPSKRRAGRMNASGIATFYGAFDLETCIAELRPAVGQTVISAKFSITEPILVLDTTRFSGRPQTRNPFAQTYITRMKIWKFMTIFMNQISKPCLPDNEHLEYITTQVISEYLTNMHKIKRGEKLKTIDAIIYKSAQNRSGKNIAIFGGASKVFEANKEVPPSRKPSNPALTLVEGSLYSCTVTAASHKSEKVYTPSAKPRGDSHVSHELV